MTGRLALVVSAVVAALFTGPAFSATGALAWKQDVDSGVQYAFFTAGNREMAVRCSGAAIEVVYYVDMTALDPALIGANSAVLEILADDADLAWVYADLFVDNNVIQIYVDGDAANDLAHTLGNAANSLVVSLTNEEPKPTSVQFDKTALPIAGAADAIKAAYKGCGITY